MEGLAAAPDRSRGFALIVVLWFLVLLSAIGIYMMANGRSETALAHNLLAGARAEAVADAAIAQIVFNQTDPDPRKRWPLGGAPRRLALPGGEATVSLVDEGLKINPNLASDALMAGLFQATGVDPGKAASLGAAVADWVDPGPKPRPLGAKKEQYFQAGKTYGPTGAPFETLDDLQLVLGMTPPIFSAALPYLTIYTDSDAPTDLKSAPAVIVRAIGLAQAASGGDAGAAQPPDAGAPPPAGAPGGQPANGTANTAAANPTAANADPPVVIGIDAVARSADGGVFARHAVIRLDSGKPKGYVVLDWRRVDLPR